MAVNGSTLRFSSPKRAPTSVKERGIIAYNAEVPSKKDGIQLYQTTDSTGRLIYYNEILTME